MQKLRKFKVSSGIFWVEVPEAGVKVLCGCPADAVKHLIKRGCIVPTEKEGVDYETGPNAILLSDISLQHGSFTNLAEFPVLHMLYKQGMGLPDHPNNYPDVRPLLIGLKEQTAAQLQYIYRGNYGLLSKEEMLETGAQPEFVDELMEIKLQFAFGKIRHPNEFIDTLVVQDSQVEIKNGVFIKRLKVNEFEISYKGEAVKVNLNLGPLERYEPTYPLGFYNVNREFFAVLHTGDGDGWDENRPCMSSIIMFHGKIYLIDMGPNLPYSLNALGIGVNEIEGVFHTHAHDDHFAGITSLIRGDHKIKYFASPLVRAAVSKKLAALLSIEESDFYKFFDVHDLELNTWNDIDDLEVMPVMSPHPVETNMFMFRTLADDGYRSYVHLADIVSFEVLEKMIRQNEGEPGISQDYYDSIRQCYLTPANIKKIDIGGGMVHGSAQDFREDKSQKLVLSHTSLELNNRDKEIGSHVAFGIVDVLITNYSEFAKRLAYEYLGSYFPDASRHQLRGLLNNRLVTFNPGSFIHKEGDKAPGVFLVLTGNVEIIQRGTETVREMSSGGIIGDMSVLDGRPPSSSYRAVNYVQAMFFPVRLYLEFIIKNRLREQIEHLYERRKFLQQTFLLGDSIPYPMQNRIALAMIEHRYHAGELISTENISVLNFVREGCVECFIGKDTFEEIGEFGVFGEDLTFFSTSSVFSFRVACDTDVYRLQGDIIKDIPIVRWKLIELSEKRRRTLLNVQDGTSLVKWRDEYSVKIRKMDAQHKKLFKLGRLVLSCLEKGEDISHIRTAVDNLIEFTRFHFNEEEKLLEEYEYPALESHRLRHLKLIEQIEEFKDTLVESRVINEIEFIRFFKDWLINHILVEDRQYGLFLNQQNIF